MHPLEKRLGYVFKNKKLLETAIIHKSYGNENRAHIEINERDNERLEFLGDAVLDLLVSVLLVNTNLESDEGSLSKMRASLVNEDSLSKIARQYNLGRELLLGRGEEQTGGREKDSILASALEAVIAAIFMDGGYDAASQWIKKAFFEKIQMDENEDTFGDFKTRLQEIVQAKFKSAPKYEITNSSGPDHDKTFEIQLVINGKIVSRAVGKSKKEAEQNAAKDALTALMDEV